MMALFLNRSLSDWLIKAPSHVVLQFGIRLNPVHKESLEQVLVDISFVTAFSYKCLIVKSDSLFQYKSGKAGKQKSPCCEARAFLIMVYILRMARKGRLMTIDESNLRKMNCQTMVIEA